MLVAVILKSFVNRETRPLDQALSAVFLPQRQFPVHQFQDEFKLFLGSFFPAYLRYAARQEQLPACREDLSAEIFFHLWGHHDASPPSGRNAAS